MSDDRILPDDFFVCVDLDGTLAPYFGWKGSDHFEEPFEGARSFLQALHQADYKITIFTCRCNEDLGNPLPKEKLVEYVRGWLEKHDLPYDEIYAGQGKPIAVAYVDDRGVSCSPGEAGPFAYSKALEEIINLDHFGDEED